MPDTRALDEVSLGELSRTMTQMREDMRSDMESLRLELRSLHGSFVPLARYEPELVAIRETVVAIVAAAKSDRERQERLRLLVLGSLVFPALLLLVGVVVTVATR